MKRLFIAALCCAAIVPRQAAAWGAAGQKAVNQLAIYGLPSGMQAFYYHYRQQLADRALEPDTRTDPHEPARHHIDVESIGLPTFMQMPMQWEAASGKYSADSLYKVGIGPWAVTEAYEHLTQAFRAANVDDILKYSIELANYTGDMNVPLHTNDRYDPRIGTLTDMWENKLVERNLDRFKLYDGDAKGLKDNQVGPYVWGMVTNAYKLANPVWDLEIETSKAMPPKEKWMFTYRLGKATRLYSDKFVDAYFDQVGGMVSAQLKLSAEAVATLWVTAWEVGGKPNLAKLLSEQPSKEEKKLLADDLKLRKDFMLVKQNRLLATIKGPEAPKPLKPGEEAPEVKPAAPADSSAAPGFFNQEEGKGKKKKK